MRERPVELEMDCYDTEGNHFGIAPSTPICVWVAVGPINWSVQREREIVVGQRLLSPFIVLPINTNWILIPFIG